MGGGGGGGAGSSINSTLADARPSKKSLAFFSDAAIKIIASSSSLPSSKLIWADSRVAQCSGDIAIPTECQEHSRRIPPPRSPGSLHSFNLHICEPTAGTCGQTSSLSPMFSPIGGLLERGTHASPRNSPSGFCRRGSGGCNATARMAHSSAGRRGGGWVKMFTTYRP